MKKYLYYVFPILKYSFIILFIYMFFKFGANPKVRDCIRADEGWIVSTTQVFYNQNVYESGTKNYIRFNGLSDIFEGEKIKEGVYDSLMVKNRRMLPEICSDEERCEKSKIESHIIDKCIKLHGNIFNKILRE